ncbi:MAG: FHA domain-containing protein [Thermodesulfobacteriota bacterium]|nr:FHA domain-containing protein [Thermodesulfobacteriota bacterium]
MGKWRVLLNDRLLEAFWVKEDRTVTIGRAEAADVRLDNVAVSRQHATLTLREGTHLLTDLGSVNGTLVNGRRVKGTVAVTETDRIQIGKFLFELTPSQERVPSASAFSDFEATLMLNARDQRRPRLRLVGGRATPNEFYLEKKKTVMLGKGANCDVRVPGWLVAKVQSYVWARGGEHYLVHVAGWRRTTLNGRKIRGEQKLRKGDTVGIGATTLRFE